MQESSRRAASLYSKGVQILYFAGKYGKGGEAAEKADCQCVLQRWSKRLADQQQAQYYAGQQAAEQVGQPGAESELGKQRVETQTQLPAQQGAEGGADGNQGGLALGRVHFQVASWRQAGGMAALH